MLKLGAKNLIESSFEPYITSVDCFSFLKNCGKTFILKKNGTNDPSDFMDRYINFLLVRSPFTYNDILDSEPRKYIRYSAVIKVPICLDMARSWRSNFRTVDGNNNRLCRLKKCMPSKHINANNDNYYIYISNST